MIQAADIREWRNHHVVDPKGHKIGVLEAIYVDTTDEPAMATVRTVAKKIAHKAEAMKGGARRQPAAPPAAGACRPRAAETRSRATSKQAGAKIKDAFKH
ncbi:hypothetical protein [Streptomyces sp. NPDC002758]